MFREHPSRTLNHRLPGRANSAVTRLTVLTVTPMIVLTMIMLSRVTLAFAGDDRNPLAGDAKAAKAGEYQFRINCALCHGLGAHGGGRGPDLTRAAQEAHALRRGDVSGDQQRHSRDCDAGQRDQRAGRRHDR